MTPLEDLDGYDRMRLGLVIEQLVPRVLALVVLEPSARCAQIAALVRASDLGAADAAIVANYLRRRLDRGVPRGRLLRRA